MCRSAWTSPLANIEFSVSPVQVLGSNGNGVAVVPFVLNHAVSLVRFANIIGFVPSGLLFKNKLETSCPLVRVVPAFANTANTLSHNNALSPLYVASNATSFTNPCGITPLASTPFK